MYKINYKRFFLLVLLCLFGFVCSSAYAAQAARVAYAAQDGNSLSLAEGVLCEDGLDLARSTDTANKHLPVGDQVVQKGNYKYRSPKLSANTVAECLEITPTSCKWESVTAYTETGDNLVIFRPNKPYKDIPINSTTCAQPGMESCSLCASRL